MILRHAIQKKAGALSSALMVFVLAFTIGLSGCRTSYLQRSLTYMNASSPAEKSKYMGEGFRSYFAENGKGAGKMRDEVLTSFMKWDGLLHPDISVKHRSLKGHTLRIYFLEQNDFSKLIGYPGWKGKADFTFDDKRMIHEYVYYPDTTNPSLKPYLKPAVEWLQTNRPAELTKVYASGRLIQTEASARLWVQLLQEWRKAGGH